MDLNRRTDIDPDWREKYAELIATPSEAMARLQPGTRVFIGTACGEPVALVNALTERARDLADLELVQVLPFGDAPYAKEEFIHNVRINSFFISDSIREAVQQGWGDYTPISLSDVPKLFRTGRLPIDVAMIQVSPPDERGMCSLGISVDIVKAAAENAVLVIAQVNMNMPRTLGDKGLHVYDMDILVPVDEPLLTIAPAPLDDVTRQIGERIASLVDDGATLEFGIGRIPHAMIEFLKGKKNLGIHTEMLTERIIELVEEGVITGSEKSKDRDKIVASFCIGSPRLYNYIHDNPKFSFRPTEYVNDPFVISQQDQMIAINTAISVDLTGQVCADSIGAKFFSGLGGQMDFNRGATRAINGKAIIALPSTAETKDGRVSRIKAILDPGSGVVTTRGDVHYVVTEYGSAYLHGKSVQERALALITIAHPDYREELLYQAIELKYLRQDLAGVEGKIKVGPPDYRFTYVVNNGTEVTFRPIRPTDAPLVKDLLYQLSEQTLYYRFFTHMKRFPSKQIQDFVYIDNRHDVAIVGVLPEAFGEQIIAVGRYYLNEKTNRAEVAFVVMDDWQNRGIGSYLNRLLIRLAKGQGISGFTAEVLRDNKAMQAVFNKSGERVTSQLNGNVYSYEIDFE